MNIKPHWLHAILTFVLTVLTAGIFLPLIRSQPETVHAYFNGLNQWVKIGFVFFLCVAFTHLMFKLLSPRARHLSHWKGYPPAWLAAMLAWFAVAVIDILGGFDIDGYRASVWEWIGYGGGSLLIVSLYSSLFFEIWTMYVGWWRRQWSWVFPSSKEENTKQDEKIECYTIEDIANAPWEVIEAWLESDSPAKYDFLDNQSVAHRVSVLISDGTRSVGIVGPFGAGKTSIVNWVQDRLEESEISGRKFFVCYHSCWGFENSTAAIQVLLGAAIEKIRIEIDTFQVDSLPDSYRRTFSAGGEWVEPVTNLVLQNVDPMEQFSRLSAILGDISARLVFIVEDLDRNETRGFEIQEVLAFLERLKDHSNFSFILTGGLSSTQRIDYPKLCDHIENLRTIQPQHSSTLIGRVRQRCLDSAVFPHVLVSDPNGNNRWPPLSDLLLHDTEELSFSESIAELLITPRMLRHALNRTHKAWRSLHGEIDFDHLLVINVLRFGALECFLFLIRRWGRLHSSPQQAPGTDRESMKRIRDAVREDWGRTIRQAGFEWNPTAALYVMEFILPASKYWIVDANCSVTRQYGQQLVDEKRYWNRAVNEAIDNGDVRDQVVISDMQAWLKSPNINAALVTNLTTLPQYCDVWGKLAVLFFVNQQKSILLLIEQVIKRILVIHGRIANRESLGFGHTWYFARNHLYRQPETLSWLEDRISEAAMVSLEMVNGLWHFYGSSVQYGILMPGDHEIARRHLIDSVRENVKDGPSLVARLSTTASGTLCDLVFDPGKENQKILADSASWSWLGPCILDAIRMEDITTAQNCRYLVDGRRGGQDEVSIDTEVLDQFFGQHAAELLDRLESMSVELPIYERSQIGKLVVAGRQHLAGRAQEENGKDDSGEDSP